MDLLQGGRFRDSYNRSKDYVKKRYHEHKNKVNYIGYFILFLCLLTTFVLSGLYLTDTYPFDKKILPTQTQSLPPPVTQVQMQEQEQTQSSPPPVMQSSPPPVMQSSPPPVVAQSSPPPVVVQSSPSPIVQSSPPPIVQSSPPPVIVQSSPSPSPSPAPAPAPSPSPSPAPAPAPAPKTVRSYQQQDFVQVSSTNTDLPNQPITGSLSDCKNACDNATGCIGFSRLKSASGLDDTQQCFLKKSFPNVTPSDSSWQTYLVSGTQVTVPQLLPCISSGVWGTQTANSGANISRTCDDKSIVTATCNNGTWTNIGACSCVSDAIWGTQTAISGANISRTCDDNSTITATCNDGSWINIGTCPKPKLKPLPIGRGRPPMRYME